MRPIIPFAIVLFASCNTSNQDLKTVLQDDSHTIYVEYDEQNKIEAVQIVNSIDSVRYHLSFNENTLTNLARIHRAKQDGKSYIFRKDGTIWSMENYENGIRQGETVVYDKFGYTDLISHYENDETWAKQTLDSLLDIHPVINLSFKNDTTIVHFNLPSELSILIDNTIHLRHGVMPIELYKRDTAPHLDTILSFEPVTYKYILKQDRRYIVFGYLFTIEDQSIVENYTLFRDTISH